MIKINKILNIQNIFCPESILIIRKNIQKMLNGQIMLIISNDPSTIKDISYFCKLTKHKLFKKNIKNIPYTYYIKINF